MVMYTLYWNNGSASITAHMALEESGAPYTLKFVDMDKGEHKSPDYLKLNPNGKVPTLLIDNKRIMFETAAIAMYIADRHPQSGLAPSLDDPARIPYTQWLFHLANSIQPYYFMFYYPERHTNDPAQHENIKAQATRMIDEGWGRVDQALAKNGPFMAGDRFSAADLPVVMLTGWNTACPGVVLRHKNVQRLVELVSARPAIKRVLKQNEAAA
jgi:glutathione S-transferase